MTIINAVSDPTPPCPTCPARYMHMGVENWTVYGPCKDGRYHHTTCPVAREEMATASSVRASACTCDWSTESRIRCPLHGSLRPLPKETP